MTNDTAHDSHAFEALLLYLKQARGFDFTGYKRASLRRRIGRRMDTVGIKTYSEYQDYLEVHPDEFAALFDTILINVTQFFRDPEAWQFLEREVLTAIVGQPSDAPIRVWSAGCATGPEAYSLAILFAEALGPEAFCDRVKIYASDADETALAYARQATYTAKEAEDIPTALREKYFEHNGARYTFRSDLRRSVIFGRLNLTVDSPISRLDLLVCRNTLMYFNAETQAQIMGRFHFALNPGGYLFLGRTETLVAHASFFSPVHLQPRIFRKNSASPRDRLLAFNQFAAHDDGLAERVFDLRRVAFDALPLASLLVDLNGTLAYANGEARKLFNIRQADFGRPFYELELSYRPVELRSRIEQVQQEQRPLRLATVEWPVSRDETRYLDIDVIPTLDDNKNLLGVCIDFFDVTLSRQLRHDLQRSHEEMETAYEELQSTNEELETTNEELQSTIEELETINEELQSTIEELETMNEELQSTNTQLRDTNMQLEERTNQLDDANALLQSIVSSIVDGVAVLDRKMSIQIWNGAAEELWGLRAEELGGQNFLLLDIGLPVDRLTAPIRRVLEKESPSEIERLNATNRRGKPIHVEVVVSPLKTAGGRINGTILLMKASSPDGGSESRPPESSG